MPPLLANVALNGLEAVVLECAKAPPRPTSKCHVKRYADDSVITGADPTFLTEVVESAVAQFQKGRGLVFGEAKTKVINIQQGLLGLRILKPRASPP